MKRQVVAAMALLSCALAASPAAAIRMEVIGDQIILSGEIFEGDNSKVIGELDRNTGKLKTVVLRDSPGGATDVGQAISFAIRARGLNTAVSGYCVSACARMYLGGVERLITSEKKAMETFIAMHGSYYQGGVLAVGRIWELQKWIADFTGGKADKDLIERMTTIRNQDGLLYIFDGARLKSPAGVSMFLCQDALKSFKDCEGIVGKDGYSTGFFTSNELIEVNKPTEEKRSGRAPAGEER